MNAELIGTWAGLVWNALDEAKATLALKAIKKATKLKVNELYAALGWLAREGKIAIAETEADVEVTLL
ncbi:MAG: winged helix-turn-helix domain-containing protein [Muribaculaceae bacterium]|nr:winged helix-turn-helix domain-containing protein [Muribaculaceae bacterium]